MSLAWMSRSFKSPGAPSGIALAPRWPVRAPRMIWWWAIAGGWYVELTDKFNTELNGKNLSPATVTAYAEFPKGSGKYWAYPTEGDADGWAYRKDLFEDPKEMEAFKAKYKRDLAVPTTWAELRDIA